jgi:hypothetical protein
VLLVSAAAAGTLLAIGVAAFMAGERSLASPGPLARVHGEVATACAACHAPWSGDADDRCALCHDRPQLNRHGADAHGEAVRLFATRPAASRALTGAAVACAECHEDHRGTEARLDVDSDRGCRLCHAMTWESHPPFAASPGPGGLQLSHSLHVAEVEHATGAGCAACHRRSPGAAHFEPIVFDTDCASCHLEDGVLARLGVPGGRPHREPATLGAMAEAERQHDPEAPDRRRAAILAQIAAVELARDRLVAPGAVQPPPSRLADEWSAAGIPVIEPGLTDAERRHQAALEAARGTLGARLARLEADAGRPSPAGQPALSLDERLEPCLVCHERDGVNLRVVTAATTAMRSAAFSHAPHLDLADVSCQTCHAEIERSALAADLNLPTVSTCRSCHGVRPDAPVACVACHTYHRAPVVPAVLR